jgi:hypothetical protein
MDLDELAVGITSPLLVAGGNGATRACHRIGGLSEDQSRPAGRDNNGVGLERLEFQRPKVHGHKAAANLVAVEDKRKHLPAFVFVHAAHHLELAHLLIQSIQKLLAGGGPGKRGTVMQRAAEPAKIEQAFFGPRKRHAHPVEQINDLGRHLAHPLYRGLIGQKIPAVNCVVQMLRRRIAFALGIYGSVYAALRAHRVRPLHRHHGNQVNIVPCFGDLHCGCKARKPAADYRDLYSGRWHI